MAPQRQYAEKREKDSVQSKISLSRVPSIQRPSGNRPDPGFNCNRACSVTVNIRQRTGESRNLAEPAPKLVLSCLCSLNPEENPMASSALTTNRDRRRVA